MSDASLSTYFLNKDFGDLSQYVRPFFYFSIGYPVGIGDNLALRRAFYRQNEVAQRIKDIITTLSSAVKQIDKIENIFV